MNDNETERRKWPRLQLKLNVEFVAVDGGHRVTGSGTTANVSAGGVFFQTPDWRGLETGQSVRLHLSGLSGYDLGPLFRSLRGEATILRLEVPEEEEPYTKAGVAARFDERPRVDVYRFSA